MSQLLDVILEVEQLAELLQKRAGQIQSPNAGSRLAALQEALWSDSSELTALGADLCAICRDLLGDSAAPEEATDFEAFEPLPLPGGSDITKPSATADTQSLRVRD